MYKNDYIEPYFLPIVNLIKLPSFLRMLARCVPYRSRVAMMLGSTNEKTVGDRGANCVAWAGFVRQDGPCVARVTHWMKFRSTSLPPSLPKVQEAWSHYNSVIGEYAGFMDLWTEEGIDAILTPANAMPAARHGHCSGLTPACWPTFIFNLFDMPAGIVPVTRVTVSGTAPRCKAWLASRRWGPAEKVIPT